MPLLKGASVGEFSGYANVLRFDLEPWGAEKGSRAVIRTVGREMQFVRTWFPSTTLASNHAALKELFHAFAELEYERMWISAGIPGDPIRAVIDALSFKPSGVYDRFELDFSTASHLKEKTEIRLEPYQLSNEEFSEIWKQSRPNAPYAQANLSPKLVLQLHLHEFCAGMRNLYRAIKRGNETLGVIAYQPLLSEDNLPDMAVITLFIPNHLKNGPEGKEILRAICQYAKNEGNKRAQFDAEEGDKTLISNFENFGSKKALPYLQFQRMMK